MRRPSLDAVRGFHRGVYVVAGARLVNVFGSGLVYPFATIYFHLAVGVPLSVVGVGLLANNVGTAIATVAGGILADRYGRKPVMVGSMAASAVAFAGYAAVVPIAAITPLGPGVWFVIVASAAGLAVGLYTPAGQSMTADLTSGAERSRAFSLLKLASNVGFGLGLAAGGLLYGYFHISVFLLDGLTSAVVAGLLVLGLPRVHAGTRERSVADSLRTWSGILVRPRVLGLVVMNVGFAVMYAQLQTTVPVVAAETLGLVSTAVGVLYVLNPLTLVVLQVPVVAAVGHWRRTRSLMASAGFWGISMLAVWGVAIVPTAVGVLLLGAHVVIRTVGEVLHQPIIVSLASDLGGTAERGMHLSVIELGKRIGFGVGSFVGGLFFDVGAAVALWPTLTGGCLLLVLGLVVLEAHLTPRENGVPAG